MEPTVAVNGSRTTDVWGTRQPHGRGTAWSARTDLHLADGVTEEDVDQWVRSACVLCSNGCGCEIAVKDGAAVGIRGNPEDRVNRGRLGPKGLYGSWPWLGAADRLTSPMVRAGDRLVEVEWDEAMGRIVETSQRLLQTRGPMSHAFYTSGQLFLEEYYTLAVIGKAGIGTPHMDGNTRLCTATAAAALKESFGCDGQPASYSDIEACDAIFLYGHDMAATQTVLWSRILDRTHGDDPPTVVCVDPRRTPVAVEAERTGGVHLAPKPGTNLALMNAMTHELIERGFVDEIWVGEHTLGFEDLRDGLATCTSAFASEICGVPVDEIDRAVEIFGRSKAVLSTVLQGFYQSHQATAASVAVNNLHLLRGMIGRPGAGVLQMNGQPTAQNTRETGADGDLPGFRNWENPEHIRELATLWNVDELVIPHWAPPTHAMQIFRYVEQGSIDLLWIAGTNPAVSMPELHRMRSILGGPQCFVVVQDLFLTETALLADVVLPAAGWGEKTGTFTNADRTVHLSEQAVRPPGLARSDLDIWLDYAERMGFTDKDGERLIPWKDPEGAFEGWKACSAGRPCDYTGLSYPMLRERSGVQWPVTVEHPDGTERLYVDGVFPTDSDYCEDFGHDLATGAVVPEVEHRAKAPDGRAFLKGGEYVASVEPPDESYPMVLTTGRSTYHFHTRTKTARAAELQAAAPDVWVEISPGDAGRLGVADGQLVEVTSRRGRLVGAARIADIAPGTVFVPFHYGYWDADEAEPGALPPRAANELTITVWDPVSKQPGFKNGACRVRLATAGSAAGGRGGPA